MKKLILIILTAIFVQSGYAQTDSINYFDQTPPSETAELFAENTISKENVHSRLVVSPDGREIFWNTIDLSTFSTKILRVEFSNGVWSAPGTPSFALTGLTANPVFSADGSKLFFNKRSSINTSWAIAYVEKTDSGWSEIKEDGFLLNTSSSFTNSGIVYFSDYMEGVEWNTGIYMANYSDSVLSDIQPLSSVINSASIDYTPYISPAGSFLLFSSCRPSTLENMYLYVSFKDSEGTWQTPQKINDAIGFSGKARYPSISPDGKYLFFCGDNGNIYWVDIKALNALGPAGIRNTEILSSEFQLSQNFPNPFNPTTTIKYSIPVEVSNETVNLKIFNMIGQEVATLVNGYQPAGEYDVEFDAIGLTSGVYLYKLSAGNYTESKKMILLR